MSTATLAFDLVVAHIRQQPMRLLVASVAVIASSCAVVWVVSGYDALVSQFDENAGRYLGRYDLLILPAAAPGGTATVDAKILSDLKQDAGVLDVNPVVQSRVSVTSARPDTDRAETAVGILVGDRPPVTGAPPLDPILVGTPAPEPPYELLEGSWLATGDTPTAVLSRSAANWAGVGVGDDLLITSVANRVRLRVAGIVDEAPQAPSLAAPTGTAATRATAETPHTQEHLPRGPALPDAFVEGVATSAVYVRHGVAARINGHTSAPNVVQVALRVGVSVQEFRRVWQSRLEEASPPLRVVDFPAVRAGMGAGWSVGTLRSQAYAATGMATMAAVFIIFTTLSMGVSERARELAILRAVGLSRAQVAAVIAAESVVLGLIGWTGGLAAGWALLSLGSRALPGLFADSALGWGCITLTGASVLVGATAAAILPAWRAMQIHPLDAVAPAGGGKPGHSTSWPLVLGTALLLVAPTIVYAVPLADQWRVWCYAVVCYPCLLLGVVLITPSVVLLCERVAGPPLARLLRLDGALLGSQLSENLWRTAGATLALSVGLTLYTSTQTWGVSMLQPFLPGRWVPDGLVAFHPVGLDDAGAQQVSRVKGVVGVMPLAVEQAPFVWEENQRPPRLEHDNAVLFGVSPDQGLTGEGSLLQLTFVEGDRQSAERALAEGGACVVSLDFQLSSGIGVGDTLTFAPPNSPDSVVSFRVAGVVSLPGWHWVTKFSGVRRHYVRTGGLIFASSADLRTDFQIERTEFFWLDLDGHTPAKDIEASLQRIAERDAGRSFRTNGHAQVTAYRPFARLTTAADVNRAITLVANEVIWGMSQAPLVTLAIMSLAVAGAMMGAVRSRAWEFGVLRAVGLTRSQIVRLVVAEALLIGIAACAVSLVAGIIAAWSGVGMALYNGGFYAGPPQLLIPWSRLCIGFGFTLALTLAAALWPAIRTGYADPLSLLRAGRAAS